MSVMTLLDGRPHIFKTHRTLKQCFQIGHLRQSASHLVSCVAQINRSNFFVIGRRSTGADWISIGLISIFRIHGRKKCSLSYEQMTKILEISRKSSEHFCCLLCFGVGDPNRQMYGMEKICAKYFAIE